MCVSCNHALIVEHIILIQGKPLRVTKQQHKFNLLFMAGLVIKLVVVFEIRRTI